MIRLIAAIDRKRGISKQSFIPWNIPDDVAYFAQMTKKYGGNVLVGAKTYKQFNDQTLAGRKAYVLTHDETQIPGATPVHDLIKFINDFKDQDLWVIGGANVYTQVITSGQADELYLTQVDADFGCDQFFPSYSHDFTLLDRSDVQEQNGFSFRFNIYKKSV